MFCFFATKVYVAWENWEKLILTPWKSSGHSGICVVLPSKTIGDYTSNGASTFSPASCRHCKYSSHFPHLTNSHSWVLPGYSYWMSCLCKCSTFCFLNAFNVKLELVYMICLRSRSNIMEMWGCFRMRWWPLPVILATIRRTLLSWISLQLTEASSAPSFIVRTGSLQSDLTAIYFSSTLLILFGKR